jgi:hypothetical protein
MKSNSMKKGEELVAAVTESFRYKKKNPFAQEEEILQHILNFAYSESENDSQMKMGMISAASKTIRFVDRHPRYNEGEVIKEMIKEIPGIIFTISQEQEA